MESSDPAGLNNVQLVVGGAEIEIELLDGTRETVLVREIRPRHMEKYLRCFDDEAKSIELFCDKPEGWADTITTASHDTLIEKGQQINVPLFDRWFRRRKERLEILSPGLLEGLKESARKAMEVVSNSTSSSAASSSAPDKAEAS